MILVFEFNVTIYDKDDVNSGVNVVNGDANVANGDANDANSDANTVNEGVLNNTTDDQFVCGIISL